MRLRIVGIGIALACMATSVHAKSKCQYFSDGREPRCSSTSDSGKDSYTQRPPEGQRPIAVAPPRVDYRRTEEYRMRRQQQSQQRQQQNRQEHMTDWYRRYRGL